MKGTVVLISSVHWHFTWQRHQNFASGLAARGYDVRFVEPLPKRWPGPRELRRVTGRLLGSSDSGLCEQGLSKGVSLINPLTLPDGSAVAQWVNRTLLVRNVARRIRASNLRRPVVVINYLPTPTSLALQRALPRDLTVYDCAWDWSNDPYSDGLERVERELAAEADLVLADSPHNTERMRALHRRVVRVEHAVDYALFEAADAPAAEPTSCVYFGDVGTNVDLDLLKEISHRYPLTLIGPLRRDLTGFSATTRVVGPVRHERIPELLRDQAILLLPYRTSDDMRGVVPAKIFECLATGKPIVATRLPSLEPFEEWIYPSSREAFLDRIQEAAFEDAARRSARQELARRNTWAVRIAEIDDLLEAELAERS